MMPAPHKSDLSDAVLLRYLLGALPIDEAEPVEEASVVDDDLAARVNAMEHDLVDSYARGEMQGAGLAKFQNWYLSSPLRVQKVEAARAFLRFADSEVVGANVEVRATNFAPEVNEASEPTPAPEVDAASEASVPPAVGFAPKFSYSEESSAQRSGGLRFGSVGAWPILGFAAAVMVLLVALGYVFNKNKQLREEVAETKQQSSELTAQLDDQRATAASGKKGGSNGVDNVATVTLFLAAPTRGANTIPKIDVPKGTGLVVLSLGLGSNDEDNYRAQLLNPTTHQVSWRSGILRPGTDGTYVSVAVPASALRSQVYLVQLMHDAAKRGTELLATYPFRAEVK